jgi:transcription antitermination factor NusG
MQIASEKLDAGTGEWYALYTRHQHEKVAAQILLGKGLDVFLPLYPVARAYAHRTKKLLLPLFPCYIFLRGGLDRRLDIVTTPGVHGFVERANRPAIIPDAEIDAVRQTVASSLRVGPHPLLKSGDRVRVRSGPLEGIEGILVRQKNLLRLVLSVEMLGQSIAVEIESSMVERIAAPPTRDECRQAQATRREALRLSAGAATRQVDYPHV